MEPKDPMERVTKLVGVAVAGTIALQLGRAFKSRPKVRCLQTVGTTTVATRTTRAHDVFTLRTVVVPMSRPSR